MLRLAVRGRVCSHLTNRQQHDGGNGCDLSLALSVLLVAAVALVACLVSFAGVRGDAPVDPTRNTRSPPDAALSRMPNAGDAAALPPPGAAARALPQPPTLPADVTAASSTAGPSPAALLGLGAGAAGPQQLVPFYPLPPSVRPVSIASLPGAPNDTSTSDEAKRYIIRLPLPDVTIPSTSSRPSGSSPLAPLHTLADAQSLVVGVLPLLNRTRVTHVFPPPLASTDTAAAKTTPVYGFSAYLTDDQLAALREQTGTLTSIEEDGIITLDTQIVSTNVQAMAMRTTSIKATTSSNSKEGTVSIDPVPNTSGSTQPGGVSITDDTATYVTRSWGLDRIDQRTLPLDGLWRPFTNTSAAYKASTDYGGGVIVYLIDTGCKTDHREFDPRGRATIAYRANKAVVSEDPNGHGTHTASVAGGALIGVGKKAEVKCLQVLDANGSATYSDILSAMNWILANAKKPAVMSMSFGGAYSQSLNDAAIALVNAGIHTVVAMGNSGLSACSNNGSGFSPASASASSDVISVGSSAANDTVSAFSNYGSCVTINAPGENIMGAWPQANATNTYALLSGTSMATPFVSGVVAMLLAKHPWLTPAAMKQIVSCSSTRSILGSVPYATTSNLLYANLNTCNGAPFPDDVPTNTVTDPNSSSSSGGNDGSNSSSSGSNNGSDDSDNSGSDGSGGSGNTGGGNEGDSSIDSSSSDSDSSSSSTGASSPPSDSNNYSGGDSGASDGNNGGNGDNSSGGDSGSSGGSNHSSSGGGSNPDGSSSGGGSNIDGESGSTAPSRPSPPTPPRPSNGPRPPFGPSPFPANGGSGSPFPRPPWLSS